MLRARIGLACLCVAVSLAACTSDLPWTSPSRSAAAPTSPPSAAVGSTSETSSAVPALPEAIEYEFGTVDLDGGDKVATLPVRGIIAFPSEGSGAPVAVILHLRGLPCTDGTEELPCKPGRDARYDKGMAWLASDLAARGYVALAPDITATRDFRFETVTVPLGWQLADESLRRLRRDPASMGVPARVTVGDTTVAVGHSVGGDNAMWWAVERPDDIAAAVLLQPSPDKPGLVPLPASPLRYPGGGPQTDRIPAGLPFAVLMGRCDDDAGYSGGLYTVNATVDPTRTAPTVTAVQLTSDHLMMNTRPLRTTIPPQAGCPDPATPAYEAEVRQTRAEVGPWVADVLDAFLGTGPWAPVTELPDASVIVMPASPDRTNVLLPIGGALGRKGPGGSRVEDPAAGAISGVTYQLDGLTGQVCTAGGVIPMKAAGREPCTKENAERPGLGPALHLETTGASGSWTASLPTAVAGELLLTISADPGAQPSQVRVSAGPASATVAGTGLAVASAGPMSSDRTVPRQVRLTLDEPVSEIRLDIDDGAVFLQDVVIASGQ